MTPCVLLSLLLAAQSDTAAINRYVQAELERQHIPGLSLAVLTGDRVLMSRGYGFANVELRVAASDSTVYQSGSMGKQFTAALVEMLIGNHLLRLDDSIVRWFPEGARVWQGITVRHLLTHTSGVAEYTDSTFDYIDTCPRRNWIWSGSPPRARSTFHLARAGAIATRATSCWGRSFIA